MSEQAVRRRYGSIKYACQSEALSATTWERDEGKSARTICATDCFKRSLTLIAADILS